MHWQIVWLTLWVAALFPWWVKSRLTSFASCSSKWPSGTKGFTSFIQTTQDIREGDGIEIVLGVRQKITNDDRLLLLSLVRYFYRLRRNASVTQWKCLSSHFQLIPAICSCLIMSSPQSHVRRVPPVWLYQTRPVFCWCSDFLL